VRLEIAFLDADEGASAPVTPATHDERAWRTVLVVAAESDVRRYVGECLRERTDLRLVEAATAAATVAAAVALAATDSPAFLVVDEPEGEVVAALANLRAIVIVDDVPHGAAATGRRIRYLARPFTAEGLLAEVGELLG